MAPSGRAVGAARRYLARYRSPRQSGRADRGRPGGNGGERPTGSAGPVAIGAAGAVLVGLGGSGLVGWYTHDLSLLQLYPGWEPMVYDTALGLVLVGLALFGLALRRDAWALPAAAYATVVGALGCAEALTGRGMGIDQLFLRAWTVAPGRRRAGCH